MIDYADELLKRWLDVLCAQVPDLDLFESHTHVGVKDPSGFSVAREQRLEALDLVGSRDAVFRPAEPDGYAEANRRATDRPASTRISRLRPSASAQLTTHSS